MSYQEKRIMVSIFTGVFIMTAYCYYAYNKVRSGLAAPDDMRFWAATMLVFIGIGVVAAIIIQILFHILLSVAIAVKKQAQNRKTYDKEIEKAIEMEMVEDEMDKLIGLKSLKIAFAVMGVGFIAALASIVLNYPPAVMLNILFASVSIGSMLEGITQLYFYRSGVKNG